MTSAIRSQYTDLFYENALPALREVIFDQFEKQPDLVPMVFKIETDESWGVQDTTYTGLGAAVEKLEGEDVTFDRAMQGYDKTYRHVTYAIAASLSEELIEDNRMNLIEQVYRSLGTSMYQTKQVTAFNILNDGFTTTGPDGENLFDTGHPLIGGGTYANRPTTDIALSVAGMREMETSLMRQTNDRGINIVIMPRTLVVPPDLKYIANELTKSEYKPQTANNEINTFNGSYSLVVSPFLTSTTAWFATAETSQLQLKFISRLEPSERSWVDEKTGSVNTRIRCRFSVGYSDYKGTWGTTG